MHGYTHTHTHTYTHIHILNIMLRLRFSVRGDCMFPSPRILRKVDLALYIPCTIWVFRGTPFRCLAWISSI